jgi:hypothetical protein
MMLKKTILVGYLILAYFASFFIASEAVGLIGLPMTINKEVVLHSGQTFDRLFLLSSVSNNSAMFYTVNDGLEYALTPSLTITVNPNSDFDGSIHVDQIGKNDARLHFDLHRDRTVNIVIGLVSILLIIPFYWIHTKILTRFSARKNQ